jgi:hypothetical protein
MSAIFGVIIFFVVIALTAVVFFGWTIFIVTRALFRAAVVMIGGEPWWRTSRSIAGTMGSRCVTRGCLKVNPPAARFCRRCGRGLPQAQRMQVRRAAVW